jgi:hypothetical protein
VAAHHGWRKRKRLCSQPAVLLDNCR